MGARLGTATTAVLLVALAGCGGGDGGGAGDGSDGDGSDGQGDLTTSMAEGLVEAYDPGSRDPSFITEDEGRCIAEALLDDPGQAALEDAGMLSGSGRYSAPDGIDQETAEAWAAAHAACIDLRDHLSKTVRVLADGFADTPAPEEAWQEAFACVRDAVTPEEAEAVFASSATGAEGPTEPGDAFNECIDAVAAG